MSQRKKQPKSESHQKVEVVFKRTLSRKNPKTGKSNYPTMMNKKQTVIKYKNGKKQVNNSNYRKIEDDKTNK